MPFEKAVNLLYPSILAVFNDELPARLSIDKDCLIEGGVIVHDLAQNGRRNQEDYILIGKGSEVYGPVHVSHNLDLRGNIFGPVSTGSFILKTPGTIYKNYLMDAVIDPSILSERFSGPIIHPGKNLKIIDWLDKIPEGE